MYSDDVVLTSQGKQFLGWLRNLPSKRGLLKRILSFPHSTNLEMSLNVLSIHLIQSRATESGAPEKTLGY